MNSFKFSKMDEIISKAIKNKYAIAHINTNNLEWAKAILQTAQETNSPIIIGVSEGAIKYQCGYKTVANMINSMIENLNITVPVVLHLDHGTYEGCKKAYEAGFSSVMFDGSHLSFEDNFKKTKELVDYITPNASFEAEVGSIGGEEDGVVGLGELADPEHCKKMFELPITVLAAGIGNVHGIYPKDWKELNFKQLEDISKKINYKGIVLHGGTGIPENQIKKAISLGVVKINVNTECQIAFQKATRKYIEQEKDLNFLKKGFDPRKLLQPGFNAIKQTIIEKLTLFGSLGKA